MLKDAYNTYNVHNGYMGQLNWVTHALINDHKFLFFLPTNNIKALNFLWSPYVIGQTIIFLPCGVYLSSSSFFFFLSSPNLSGRRLDVCHTSTRGVALVRI